MSNTTSPITKEQIIEAENNLIEAMKINDVETLDQLLHDDLLFITPDGQTITKKMDLDSHKSKTMIIEEIIPTIEKINLIEETAVVTIVFNTKGKMLGTPIAGKYRYIRFWKLVESTLKVIGGSCTPI